MRIRDVQKHMDPTVQIWMRIRNTGKVIKKSLNRRNWGFSYHMPDNERIRNRIRRWSWNWTRIHTCDLRIQKRIREAQKYRGPMDPHADLDPQHYFKESRSDTFDWLIQVREARKLSGHTDPRTLRQSRTIYKISTHVFFFFLWNIF
jgi:hypothetical protein